MDRSEILRWLHEDDPERLEGLWARADAVRRQRVGDEVHLRGLIEFSNHCVRHCTYCGLRAPNRALRRCRMTAEEILAAARRAVGLGYGTVVLQSGEDHGVRAEWLADVIRRIKAETPLAVTLSVGERPEGDLAVWRDAGADRYLLRFETSDRALYDRIHPGLEGRRSDRIAILRTLDSLGYETGGGVMVGIPGQTYGSLADDVVLFRALDLDMVGLGPYVPHPATPLGQSADDLWAPPSRQVPSTSALMAHKMVALTRLACPLANLPSTTAVATVNATEGHELGLQRGANVVMPNVTPQPYRALYQIYPSKAGSRETAEESYQTVTRCIFALGRSIGKGPGASPNWLRRHQAVTAV